MDVAGADEGVTQLRILPAVASFQPEGRDGVAVVAGRREIAQRVVQALEAGDVPAALLPSRVADLVLRALGSSAAEHEDQARRIARSFRADLVAAVEESVTRALLGLGPNT